MRWNAPWLKTVGLVATLAALSASAAETELPDPVLGWNRTMLDAIRLETTAPTLATRNLAILHAAIYDAVNSVETTHQPYRTALTAPPGTSAQAAALAAGFEVLSALYPSVSTRTDALFDSYRALLPATTEVDDGLILGQLVAFETLEDRAADGSSTSVPYIPSDAPGQWRRTPPFFRPPVDPQWGAVVPFCLPQVQAFAPPGPPPLDSEEYAAAFNELKEFGAKESKTRTAEQSQTAVFWSDFTYTATPPGHWDEIASVIAKSKGNTLAENARLFALISMAQADSAIICWWAKYRFNFWRPVTALQRGDEDGNPLTIGDPGWASLLNAPNFPEYTSGHSTFSKATAQVLTLFYGTDALTFTVNSDALPAVFRTYTSLAACADEIGQSRVFGGIHFQFSNRDGKACGKRIGNYVSANFLLSNDGLPCLVRDDAITQGGAGFRVHGHIGKTFVIEASEDLDHWVPISTNAAVTGGIPLIIPSTTATARYFRAVEP